MLGFELKDGSLTNYAGDPLVSVTLALLIILGGLGFIAISDVYFKKVFPHIQRIYHRNKTQSKQKKVGLNFHTQVVLMTTATPVSYTHLLQVIRKVKRHVIMYSIH